VYKAREKSMIPSIAINSTKAEMLNSTRVCPSSSRTILCQLMRFLIFYSLADRMVTLLVIVIDEGTPLLAFQVQGSGGV
jgi:hypothetical protein